METTKQNEAIKLEPTVKKPKEKRKAKATKVNLTVRVEDFEFLNGVATKLNNKKELGSLVYPHHIVALMVKRQANASFDEALEMVIRPKDIVEMKLKEFRAKNPGKTRDDFFAELIKNREKSSV